MARFCYFSRIQKARLVGLSGGRSPTNFLKAAIKTPKMTIAPPTKLQGEIWSIKVNIKKNIFLQLYWYRMKGYRII